MSWKALLILGGTMAFVGYLFRPVSVDWSDHIKESPCAREFNLYQSCLTNSLDCDEVMRAYQKCYIENLP